MPVNLPGGLGGLLAKMLGAQPGGEKVAKQEMKGKEGPKKGEALGADGALLAGLGFSEADKTKAPKNVQEKENVARFLQDPKAEVEKLLSKNKGEEPKEAKEKREAREPEAPREAREARREERAEEARPAPEAKEQREAKEQKEAAPAPRERERERQEEGRGGHAQVRDEAEDERQGGSGDGSAEVFGDETRCHGHLFDGARCLRRAVEGSPFCPEHGPAGLSPIDNA